MKEIFFSINSWIFGNIPIEEAARRAQKIGVKGLDINGEPDTVDVKNVKNALKKYNLAPVCISGNFLDDSRTFSHRDEKYRKMAIEYGQKCVDMAVALESKKILLVPSQIFKPDCYLSKEEDWKHAVESLREVADYALNHGNITIMMECVNKYEVSLVRTLEDGIRMSKEIGRPNVKIVGDTFHMHMEEGNGIHNALRKAGKEWLAHLHLGDNTREVPGRGCINWREIFIALNDINYEEAISFEPLPHHLSPEEITNGGLDPEELDKELTFSVNYLNAIMQTVN